MKLNIFHKTSFFKSLKENDSYNGNKKSGNQSEQNIIRPSIALVLKSLQLVLK